MRISDWSSDVCSSDLDRRDDARGVDLERQMAAVGLHPAALRRALRILDEDAALRAFHEADEGDDDDRAANDGEDRAAAHRAFADLREHLREAARQLGENARHDDQRNAVRSEEHTSELQSIMRIAYAG